MNKRSSQDGSTRYLIFDPATGWRILPAQQVLATFNGVHCLPEYAGCTIRFVAAYLQKWDDGLEYLHWLDCSEWAFDADGRVDQSLHWSDILRKVDPVGTLTTIGQPSSQVLSIGLSVSQIEDICAKVGVNIGQRFWEACKKPLYT